MITLGIEEEIQIIDEQGRLTSHVLKTSQPPHLKGKLDKEIHQCVIELQTDICETIPQLVAALQQLRGHALKEVSSEGKRLLIGGLHPCSLWHEHSIHEGEDFPYYTQLVHEYQDITRSALSFGMHLHLGLPAYMPKIKIMNHLRQVLPEVLALSASSPFVEGRDTGLQSWRHSLLDRYPRMGIPDVWKDEFHYQGHVERLRKLGCLHPEQSLWQDLRLHQRYNTLEVRIMDTHPDMKRIALIARLLKGEVLRIWGLMEQGLLKEPWERPWIEENKWRARRHGLDATWIDWERDETCDSALHFDTWVQRLSPYMDPVEWLEVKNGVETALQQGTFASEMRKQQQHHANWKAFIDWFSLRTHSSIEADLEENMYASTH